MASVVVYKRESYVDIIPEDDYYIPSQHSPQEIITNFGLFDLPDPIAVKIVSHLSLQDTNAVANTCRIGRQVAQDQLMWRNKLWIRAKVQNLSLMSPSQSPHTSSTMLVRDPLLVNNKELYKMLDPDSGQGTNTEALDYGNLLSKMVAPPPTSMGFIETLENFFNGMFGNTLDISQTTDPLSKGEGAPTFLLFGTQETRVSKKLALSFIASKNSTFETVGLVKGKPGGVGGGVTVRYGQQLMNLLTVRRARPRLLVQGQQGTTFHPDVAEVAARVDGLICYMDATCWCTERDRETTNKKAQESEGQFKSSSHSIDVLELEAMLRTIPPNLAPPILVLLAHTEDMTNTSSDCETHEGVRTSCSRHSPAWLHPVMARLDLPWAICEVEVSSLSGVHQGLNWLLKRTLKINNG